MAATSEVDALPGESCPCCRGGFARDLKGRGYRRHLKKLPKRDKRGRVLRDKNGKEIMCGGTPESWGKGHYD